MTNQTRVARESWGTCPDPEMLSVYLEGKLDETQRGPIEEHISRCEDCYFVVREAAVLGAEGAGMESPGAVSENMVSSTAVPDNRVPDNVVPINAGRDVPIPSGTNAPAAAPAGLPRPFASRLLPMAATLVMAAGALMLWRQAHPVDPYAEAVRPLVEAVGKRRFFDARLTGGFQYGERISPKRGAGDPSASAGATGPAAEDWGILAAAARIKQEIGTPKNADERAALASAHLVLGDFDEAIRELNDAIDNPSANDARRAHLLSNRAAARLTRASARADNEDYLRALEDTTRALKISPTLDEALYNRALSLEGLGRREEATAAWDAFLSHTRDFTWREEATRHKSSLVGGTGAALK